MQWKGAACAAGLALLAACGGGGTTSTGRNDDDVGSNGKIAHFAGSFISACEESEARKESAAGPKLWERTRILIRTAGGSSARFELRVDFHDNEGCGDARYAESFLRTEDGNLLTLTGVTHTGGRAADRVDVVLAQSTATVGASGFYELPGRAAGELIYVPRNYGAAASYKDLVYLEGVRLYWGGEQRDANGYPSGLDLTAYDTRI